MENTYRTFGQPVFKGRGEHSVRQLESLLEDYEQFCSRRQVKLQRLRTALSDLSYEVEKYRDAILGEIHNEEAAARFEQLLDNASDLLLED